MKQVKVIMLILTTLMLAWLLTDYNIFQYTFISDVFLIGLSIFIGANAVSVFDFPICLYPYLVFHG